MSLNLPTRLRRLHDSPWTFAAALGGTALAAAAPFLPWLFEGRTLAARDTGRLYAPLRGLVVDALRSFRLPLWNPYEGGGKPLLAEGIHGVLHPVSIAAAWLASSRFLDCVNSARPARAVVEAIRRATQILRIIATGSGDHAAPLARSQWRCSLILLRVVFPSRALALVSGTSWGIETAYLAGCAVLVDPRGKSPFGTWTPASSWTGPRSARNPAWNRLPESPSR